MPSTSGREPRKRGRPTAQEREERKDQILDAAVELFVARGYGQVSIDDLAPLARVTKRTVYAYFGDKAQVFVAAIERFRLRAVEDATATPEPLVDLVARLVRTLHSDEAVGMHRLMIAESPAFPELAAAFYRDGPEGYVAVLRSRLGRRDRAKAEALFGLLLGEPHRRRLLGLADAPTAAEAVRYAREILDALGIDPEASAA